MTARIKGYEREMERVRQFGGELPACLSLSEIAGTMLLVGIQAVIFASLTAILVIVLTGIGYLEFQWFASLSKLVYLTASDG